MRLAFNTILFLYLVVLPHSIYMMIDLKYNALFLSTLFGALFISVLKLKLNLISASRPLFFFTCIIFVLSILVFMLKEGVNQYAVIFLPIFSLISFNYISKFKIDLRWFNFVFAFFYIYFYLIYFSKLPDLFYRPGFDEDAIVFERASSNGISMALNMTLYSYVILEYYFNQNRKKDILIIGLINLCFIIIQQSRAGVVCAIFILLIILYEHFRKYFKSGLIFTLIVAAFVSVKTRIFHVFIERVGLNVRFSEDIRSEAVLDFLNIIWQKDFILGAPISTTFSSATYTFNVFLDFWNNYSFFGFLILILFFLLRYINRRKYYFPIYYFIPFFTYAFFESIFLPNYWDAIIYLLLFVKIKPEFLKSRCQIKSNQ